MLPDTFAHTLNTIFQAVSKKTRLLRDRSNSLGIQQLVGPNLVSFAASAFIAMLCAGCRSTPGHDVAGSTKNDDQIVAAEQEHRMKVEVTGKVKVYKLLREDDEGLRHEKFLVMLSDGSTVLVAHSIDEAPAVPVNPEETIIIHGEYIWNQKGGVIHWTHHSNSPRHEGGWIEYKGKRYE